MKLVSVVMMIECVVYGEDHESLSGVCVLQHAASDGVDRQCTQHRVVESRLTDSDITARNSEGLLHIVLSVICELIGGG